MSFLPRRRRKKPTTFGAPTDVKGHTHVTVDERSSTGFSGLTPVIHHGFLKIGLYCGLPHYIERSLVLIVYPPSPPPRIRDLLLRTTSLEICREDPEETFTKEREIGFGEFGPVFRAVERNTGRKVAVKVVSSEWFAQVRTEIATFSKIEHRNIVEYFGTYWYREEIWMVTLLMDRVSLSALLRGEAVSSEGEIAFICREVLKAVAFLHANHALHGHIRSDNILLDRHGHVRVGNLGFRLEIAQEQRYTTVYDAEPYWMAPEMIKGFCSRDPRCYDARVDTWGTAVTAIEIAQGKPPFFGKSYVSTLSDILRPPPPKLEDPEQWSPTFRHYLKASLVYNPLERASCADLLLHPFMTLACSQEDFSAMVRESWPK